MTRILITDGEQRSSLAVVRSLGRAGHTVYVASALGRPLAGASRYASGSRLVPDPFADVAGFRRAVEEAVDDLGVEVLIPMTDVSAPILLALRATHPDLVIPFPDLADYEGISDKGKLVEVGRSLAVPVPAQKVLDAPPTEGEDWLGDWSGPVVLKPVRSAVVTPGGVRKLGVALPGTHEEARRALASYPEEAYPILVQQRITGPGLGVFVLSHNGQTMAAFAHRRLRERPPSGGVSSYRESVAVRPDLLDHAERILAHFRWTGVAMVEFKEEEATGTPYLMEVNGRFWGSLQLAIDSGVDFPRLLVDMVTGHSIDPVTDYELGARSRWLWGDVDHLIGMLKAAGRHRAANPALPGRVGSVGRFLVPWKPRDRYEVLWLRDPGPFLRESMEWFRTL